MARPEARTCLFCFQPLTHLHGSLGAAVSCPTCTGLYEFEVYSKAGPPRETGGGDEWRRCDSCQRMFRGGMPSSSLLCPICRVRVQYDFAAGSYASSKDPRRRSGRKKKLTALPDVRQSSPEEVKGNVMYCVKFRAFRSVRTLGNPFLPLSRISRHSWCCTT